VRGFFAKWSLCLLMMAATTLVYLDRQAVGLLAPTIQRQLNIDNAGLGWIFAAFYYAYTLAQFAVGLLLDRYSLRWLYGGAILAWALASTLTGLAQTLAMLMAFRVLLGLIESGSWPGALRIVSRTLPPEERALGNGIFTSGTSVASLIAPGLVLGISTLFGWRSCFAALGILGLSWFVVWVIFTRKESLSRVWRACPGEPCKSSAKDAYLEVLGLAQFWRVLGLAILVNPILYFFLNWLPTYYKQQHGIDPSARLAGILTLTFLGLDLGYLSCGASVLLLTRRGLSLRTARRCVFLTASLLLAGIGIVPLAKSFPILISLIVLAVFAIGVWLSMYLTIAQEVSYKNVSTAAGLLGGSGSLAGAFLMWGVGRVTQATGSFSIPFLGISVMAVLAALVGWTASRTEPAL
jgi:ACS family hexuronate transporter-like MFS transporter